MHKTSAFFNSLGIDTFRFIVSSKTLDKFLNKNELEITDDSGNIFINQYFKEKEVKQSKDYKVQYVQISNEKNLSAYMIVKQNHKSQSIAGVRKKAKDYYCEVVFAGLRQPTKMISMDTYRVLSKFIERFKVSDIDICFDGFHELEVSQKNINMYRWNFRNYIAANGDTKMHFTSFYINKPMSAEDDADRYKKIILYDKYAKESNHKTLDSDYERWKRLEVTVKVDSKFTSFMMNDYILDMQNLVKKHFNADAFNLEYLDLQLLLIKDKRIHKSTKNINDLNKEINSGAFEVKKTEPKRINAMKDLVTDTLIENIKARTIKINATKLSLIRFWFEQGSELIQLQTRLKCTQDKLTAIVDISKGGVYNFMKIAKDERIKKILNDSHSVGVETSIKSLEQLTQKDLVKLTSLDDVAFTKAVASGKLPIVKSSDMQGIKLTPLEQKQREVIQKLKEEIKSLKDNLSNSDSLDVEVIDVEADVIDEVIIDVEFIAPSPNKNNSIKAVHQIDLNSHEIIRTFKSLALANILTGVGISSISRCANGIYNQAGSYMWKFADADNSKGTVHLFSDY